MTELKATMGPDYKVLIDCLLADRQRTDAITLHTTVRVSRSLNTQDDTFRPAKSYDKAEDLLLFGSFFNLFPNFTDHSK